MFYAGGGRPKGALNYATRELKQELRLFFSGPEYRDSVKKRIVEGSAPTVELYFLQLLYGKPKEQIALEVSVQDDLSQLSVEELTLRAGEMLKQLQEASELEAAISTPYVVHSDGAEDLPVQPLLEPEGQDPAP
jgi:hypothetical protein